MKKRLARILVLTIAAAAITACGQNSESGAGAGSQANTETNADEDSAEPEEPAEPEEVILAAKYKDDGTDVSSLDGVKIGYAQRNTNGAWLIAQTENLETVSDELGVNFVMTDADDDQAKQISDVEDLCSQGIDVLVYPAIEYEAGASALNIAKNAGVPVFLLGNDVKKSDEQYVTSILFDYTVDGNVVGQWLADNYSGEELNIVEISGIEGSDPAVGRADGFRNAIADESGFEIIASQTGDFLMDQAQDVMANLLQSYGDDIDVVFCHTDEMSIGAVSAIEAAGYKPGKDIMVLGIDGQKAAVDLIRDGKINAVSTCDTQDGEYLYNYIAKYLNGETLDKKYTIPSYVIDSENCDEETGF